MERLLDQRLSFRVASVASRLGADEGDGLALGATNWGLLRGLGMEQGRRLVQAERWVLAQLLAWPRALVRGWVEVVLLEQLRVLVEEELLVQALAWRPACLCSCQRRCGGRRGELSVRSERRSLDLGSRVQVLVLGGEQEARALG